MQEVRYGSVVRQFTKKGIYEWIPAENAIFYASESKRPL
jgi:hypothetical protein